MDNDVVSIEFFETLGGKRESIGVSTFTVADAKAAGTQNLTKFPRNMLFARAISNGVRWFCPDVFSGSAVYTPEELGAIVDAETGEIVSGSYTVQDAPPANGALPDTLAELAADPAGAADDTPEAFARRKFHAEVASTFGGMDLAAARHLV